MSQNAPIRRNDIFNIRQEETSRNGMSAPDMPDKKTRRTADARHDPDARETCLRAPARVKEGTGKRNWGIVDGHAPEPYTTAGGGNAMRISS